MPRCRVHEYQRGDKEAGEPKLAASYGMILAQIAVIEIVFSLDSVITAVGVVDDVAVMAVAIIIAVSVMMFASNSIGEFVDRHPNIKMLALNFLILVGVVLIGEGLDMHIPKGYIYFAMGFAVMVEMFNIHMRTKRAKPVHLHKTMPGQPND